MPTAQFKFSGSLNDFLSLKKNSWMDYTFYNSPSVKDAIEAIGIPHTEVNQIFINQELIPLTYLLSANDKVEVFPFTQINSAPQKFILDVHLGKLAKRLRLLGFDSIYENDFKDKDIVSIAKEQERIVLTRDVGLLKHKAIRWGYWLRSQMPMEQVKEVIQRFALANLTRPFTRCLVCNGVLEKAGKEKIIEQLPPDTILYFHEFYQCANCKKIYWKGSHYERMIQMVKMLVN